MRLIDIAELLKGEVLTGEIGLNREVESAFASDLMSDVLTIDHNNTVLITGLSNMQSVRTAEMSDISQIVIARNKEVNKEMLDVATTSGIAIIRSHYSMFRVSGILYDAGIRPIY